MGDNTIVSYILHDPISNSEGRITEFDKSLLEEAVNSGMVLIANHIDGRREIVGIDDVKETNLAQVNGITIATPKYVDDKISAVIDVIKALGDMLPDTIKSEIKGKIDAIAPAQKD